MKPGDVVDDPWGSDIVVDPFGPSDSLAGQATVVGASLGRGMADAYNPAKIGAAATLAAPALANAMFPGIGDAALPASQKTAAWLERNSKHLNPARLASVMPYLPQQIREAIKSAVPMTEKSSKEVAKDVGVEYTPGLDTASRIANAIGSATSSYVPFGASGANFAKGLAANAGYGALMGTGEVVGNAIGGPAGATIGSLLGMGLPTAAAAGIAGARGATNAVRQFAELSSPATAEKVTGKLLARAGLPETIPPAPLPGMRGTVGMMANNPDLIAMERAAMARTANAGMREDIGTINRGIVADTLARQAGQKLPEAASRELADSYRGLRQNVKNYVSPNIEAAKEAVGSVSMPGNVLKGYVNKLYKEMTDAERAMIPSNARNLLKQQFNKKVVPFREVDSINSLIKASARDMPPGTQQRMFVEGFARELNNLFAYKQPGVKEAYQQYGAFKQSFDSNKRVGDLFTKKGPGVYDVEGSKFGAKLFSKPEEAIQYMAKLPAQDARRLGKEYLVSTLADSVRVGGAPTPSDIVRFMKSNRAAINNFFSTSDRAALQKVHDAIAFNDRLAIGARGPGSQTYEKFAQDSFLNKAVNVVSKVPFIKGYTKDAMAELRSKVDELLVRAAFDPVLAKTLAQKATKGNVAFIEGTLKGDRTGFAETLARIAAMNLSRSDQQ